MMTEPRLEPPSFYTQLEHFYSQIAKGDLLEKFRGKAWDHFQELGLPTVKSEVFRYVKLRSLYSQTFVLSEMADIAPQQIESFIYPECRQALIVFVNGHYSPKLSNLENLKRLVVLPLNEATRTYGALLTNQWAKSLKEETDPFAVLNSILHRDGVFMYIPPKTIVESPIQILHVIDAKDAKMALMPRLHLFVGAQSQTECLFSQGLLSGKGYWVNQSVDVFLEDDSHAKIYQNSCGAQSDVWHFEALRAGLKRNSTLKTVNVTEGSATLRSDYRVQLNGENGEALLNGVWMLSEKREAHTHVLVDHQAPFCRSMQLFKGVLNDFGRSSFEGKILVRQAAQKTDAFQLNNNLLLSERAMAYSKPNLEIFADDVKASHGSTVGQIDAEQLFYLKTRGLSEGEAKNILVYGYCKEVIDMITADSLLKEVSRRAQRYVTGIP